MKLICIKLTHTHTHTYACVCLLHIMLYYDTEVN